MQLPRSSTLATLGLLATSLLLGAQPLLSTWQDGLPAGAPPEQTPSTSFAAERMARAANTLIASFTPAQREDALLPFDDAKARTTWTNLPASIVPRTGTRLGDLDDVQRRHFHRLLRASTSSQGYLKMASIIQLDERLGREAADAVAAGTRRLPADLVESWTSANYWIRIFGDPTESSWGWQLSGHHLGANFTVVEGQTTQTPTFLGAEPDETESGLDAGWRPLGHEAERGFDLVASLDDAQRAAAVLGNSVPRDIFTGPGRKDALTEVEGLAASELTDEQETLLWSLIGEYVANARPDSAASHLAEIRADGPGSLRFAWFGPVDDEDARYYYRVHGPSVLIEYVVEEGVGGSAANHVHSIVRHPENDYGADWLQVHYEEHHPPRRRRRR